AGAAAPVRRAPARAAPRRAEGTHRQDHREDDRSDGDHAAAGAADRDGGPRLPGHQPHPGLDDEMSYRTTQTPPAACLRPALCLLAAGLLAACGTPKSSYPGAEAQQLAQRSAQADALPAGAVADPQATHHRLIEQMQREGLWYASLAHID